MTEQSFKNWLLREYLQIPVHAFHVLAVDIITKWPEFPDDPNKTQIELEVWLSNHGACSACLSNFANAWKNYINDTGYHVMVDRKTWATEQQNT